MTTCWVTLLFALARTAVTMTLLRVISACYRLASCTAYVVLLRFQIIYSWTGRRSTPRLHMATGSKCSSRRAQYTTRLVFCFLLQFKPIFSSVTTASLIVFLQAHPRSFNTKGTLLTFARYQELAAELLLRGKKANINDDALDPEERNWSQFNDESWGLVGSLLFYFLATHCLMMGVQM